MPEPVTTELTGGYAPAQGFHDELFAGEGKPRAHAAALVAALQALGPEQLAQAGDRRDAIFMQQGITFEVTGTDADEPSTDRPWPLDLVPRIIDSGEWQTIKRGVAQRVRALNAFVDDVYHGREIVHAKIVPWQLVVSRSNLVRAVHGIRPPAAWTATSRAATSSATSTAHGACSRTTCARPRASPMCSRTGWP